MSSPIPSSVRCSAAPGAAFTWADNSRENRLTPFANDPITDPTGEAIFLRDEDDGDGVGRDAGSAASSPRCGRWVVRHAAGVTHFQFAIEGLEQELAICVAPDDPVKVSLLTLTNTRSTAAASERVRVCRVGARPAAVRRTPLRRHRARRRTGAILARNAYNTDFKDRVAFLHATEPPRSFTCDRADFIGRNRYAGAAGGAVPRQRSADSVGAGLDPCAALQIAIEIRAGGDRDRSRSCSARGATARTRSRSLRDTHASTKCDAAIARSTTILGRHARRRPGPYAR